jgi:hypothetical protein
MRKGTPRSIGRGRYQRPIELPFRSTLGNWERGLKLATMAVSGGTASTLGTYLGKHTPKTWLISTETILSRLESR